MAFLSENESYRLMEQVYFTYKVPIWAWHGKTADIMSMHEPPPAVAEERKPGDSIYHKHLSSLIKQYPHVPVGALTSIARRNAVDDAYWEKVKKKNKEKPDLIIGVFFDGTNNNMMIDPPEKHTNVAKLYNLYKNEKNIHKIYIQGVGTKAVSGSSSDPGMKKDTSVFGLAFGLGPMGADARLNEARQRVLNALQTYQDQYDGPPDIIKFDVFGFSRGAMLARHFVNMVNFGLPDFRQTPMGKSVSFHPNLRSFVEMNMTEYEPDRKCYPKLQADVQVRFLGIFDSVGSFFWPGNDKEGFINPYLKSGSAEYVCHLTARNEIRQNFPLTRICDSSGSHPDNFSETPYYGAHSDIGGGYAPGPETALVHDEGVQYSLASMYGDWAEQMRNKARKNGWTVKFKGTHAFFYETRNVLPELSHITLHDMHEIAMQKGVPLNYIDPSDTIPPVLSDLVTRAEAGDAAALEQLTKQYIHISHNKLSLPNRPEPGGVRKIFPNQPGQAI